MKLFSNIDIPNDAVTMAWAIVARRGAGKTYAGQKTYEVFYQAGVQCIAIDPVGNWYGLRLDKSGKKQSTIDAPIFGGIHADIPIRPEAGGIVAAYLLDSGASAIIDVSQMRKGERIKFITQFAEEFFHQQKSRRIPVHLFIDEAQVFIPQQSKGDTARMLGAMEDIVRLGRNFGIGVTMLTQRPQSVNKEVLNQAEPLIVMQLVGSHEREAIRKWISHNDADVTESYENLPHLENGEGYFWSPGWLRKFEKIRYLPKNTFDASATPTIGGRHTGPVDVKKVDLKQVNEKIQSLVDDARANDPAELKRTITKLQGELRKFEGSVTQTELRRQVAAAKREGAKDANVAPPPDTSGHLKALEKIAGIATKQIMGTVMAPAPAKALPGKPAARMERMQKKEQAMPTDGTLPGPQQKIINSLAWWEATGIPGPYSHTRVAVVAGYSPKSSSFKNPLGALKSAGLLDYPIPKMLDLTQDGRALAQPVEAVVSNHDLHNAIYAHLKGPQRKILEHIIAAYPNEISHDELAPLAGYSASSSSFKNPLGSLKSLGFITYPYPRTAKAVPDLFVDGATRNQG